MKQNLEAIVFMKFGYHALEGDKDIITRKQNEFISSGKIFWGYGGSICHPLYQVQPFVKEMKAKGRKVFLAMSFTKSKPGMANESALMFSADGLNWKDIPKGIRVTGSKYAIVCSNLEKCDVRVNLNDYAVAIGPSKGKIANNYIVFRVDKGCLMKEACQESTTDRIVHIQLIAEIVEPFAVVLK